MIWATINSVLFIDNEGIMVNNTTDLDLLGTQLLGLAMITILVISISWMYFFPMKRLATLRVPISIEVIGRDTIMNAESKGLDLTSVIEKIEDLYPEAKKKGC